MLKKILASSVLAISLFVLMFALFSVVSAEEQGKEAPVLSVEDPKINGIQQIVAEVYANESFPRVRGSASARSQISGSSVVIGYQGGKYILTNFHVVKSMVDIYVEDLKTGSVYAARVIGRDPVLDLALLTLPRELEYLSSVSLADALIGETVFAIGFPFDVRNVTYGIITSKELVNAMFLLSQAPLNPGNSGGPLLNAKQEIVGINTAYRPQANLYSFSIPSSYVQKILPQLVEGGTIRHAHPKLAIGDFRDLLPRDFAEMGIVYPPKKSGVVIVGFHDATASQQEIEIGDIILAVDGVRTETVAQYVQHLLFSYKPGQRAKFLLLRGSEEIMVEVKLSPITIE